MSRLFPTFPTFLGFDNLLESLERFAEHTPKMPGWPPFNVVKEGDNRYLIEFALAGFQKSDVSVTVEGDQLVVKGTAVKDDHNTGLDYIYKGISSRNFEQKFNLSDSMTVKSAEFVNGVLTIVLDNMAKISKAIKQIEVK
jgi:molecular chaperone IbpA